MPCSTLPPDWVKLLIIRGDSTRAYSVEPSDEYARLVRPMSASLIAPPVFTRPHVAPPSVDW